MYSLLIRLILISALYQLGLSASDFRNCHGQQCVRLLEKKSREVLGIEWRPISVFQSNGH